MPDWLSSPEKITLVGLLFGIIWAGIQRWWVFGWAYDRETARADRFEALALKTIGLAEQMTDLVQAAGKQRSQGG